MLQTVEGAHGMILTSKPTLSPGERGVVTRVMNERGAALDEGIGRLDWVWVRHTRRESSPAGKGNAKGLHGARDSRGIGEGETASARIPLFSDSDCRVFMKKGNAINGQTDPRLCDHILISESPQSRCRRCQQL
jgi:hypothetical protein